VMLPMLFSEGVRSGRLSLERFVEVTATNAARLFGIYPRKGTIAVGADADLVLWDADAEATISAASSFSRVDYSIYEGRHVKGLPRYTISRGEIVYAPDFRSGLFRVAVSGGPPTPLTRMEEGKHTTHRWPSFLPDGVHVLYLAANHANPRSEDSGIYVTSVDGGPSRRLMASYGSAQYASGWLLSVRDTSLLAFPFDARRIAIQDEPVRVADDVNFDLGVWRGSFSASSDGVLAYQIAQAGIGGQLTWFDSSGRRLSTVGEKSEAYSPQLSPDGRRALVIVGDPNNDIWVYELDRGVRTRLTTAAQVTVSPVWSPDGAHILTYIFTRPDNPDHVSGYDTLGIFDVTNASPPVMVSVPGLRTASWQRLAP